MNRLSVQIRARHEGMSALAGVVAETYYVGGFAFDGWCGRGRHAMVFTLTAHERGAETVLQLAGELDLGTRDQLTEHVGELISSGRPVVRADLAGLTFMDSSGLAALLVCKQACDTGGGRFQVVGADGLVATVLKITGLDKAFSGAGEGDEAAVTSAAA